MSPTYGTVERSFLAVAAAELALDARKFSLHIAQISDSTPEGIWSSIS